MLWHRQNESRLITYPRPRRAAVRRPLRGGTGIVMVLALVAPWPAAYATAAAAPSITVKANKASGQPVGTTITWTATATGMKNPVYRFSVASGGSSSIVRDFGQSASFKWTPMQEGAYTIQATVKEGFSASSSAQQTAGYTVTSRVTGKNAVVSATANPLVALYSAPACAGSLVVQFRPASGSSAWQSTAARPCVAGQSVNVLVAGMKPATQYTLQSVVTNSGSSTTSSPLSFTTGAPEKGLTIAKFTVAQAATAQSDQKTPLIFHALNVNPSPKFANPIATDLSGNLVWYYDTLHSGLATIWPVHILPGGTFLIYGRDQYRKTGDNVYREVDLAGNTVRETNVDAVSAQLTARGQEEIYQFHHDAIRLPNGDTAVLGATQKKFNGHDVMGDMIIVLDPNLQVTWTWDVFDHITPPATFPKGAPTCLFAGPFLCGLPDPKSFDFTHANALDWVAQDKDLLLSSRSLSLVFKLDYADGKGSGKILWRLGKGGDFTAKSSDPYPWFGLQHNANFIKADTMIVFDDGNTRCQNGKVKGCQSRGQEWKLDEQNHTATLVVNSNLGRFWQALGSAQGLPNGNLTFAGGYPPPSKEVEVTQTGAHVYELDTGVAEYRAYRIGALSF